MHLEGVRFLDDLELERFGDDLKQVVSLSLRIGKCMMKQKRGTHLSKHEKVLKSIIASPEEKILVCLSLKWRDCR